MRAACSSLITYSPLLSPVTSSDHSGPSLRFCRVTSRLRTRAQVKTRPVEHKGLVINGSYVCKWCRCRREAAESSLTDLPKAGGFLTSTLSDISWELSRWFLWSTKQMRVMESTSKQPSRSCLLGWNAALRPQGFFSYCVSQIKEPSGTWQEETWLSPSKTRNKQERNIIIYQHQSSLSLW